MLCAVKRKICAYKTFWESEEQLLWQSLLQTRRNYSGALPCQFWQMYYQHSLRWYSFLHDFTKKQHKSMQSSKIFSSYRHSIQTNSKPQTTRKDKESPWSVFETCKLSPAALTWGTSAAVLSSLRDHNPALVIYNTVISWWDIRCRELRRNTTLSIAKFE